jgi:hypothetical protein
MGRLRRHKKIKACGLPGGGRGAVQDESHDLPPGPDSDSEDSHRKPSALSLCSIIYMGAARVKAFLLWSSGLARHRRRAQARRWARDALRDDEYVCNLLAQTRAPKTPKVRQEPYVRWRDSDRLALSRPTGEGSCHSVTSVASLHLPRGVPVVHGAARADYDPPKQVEIPSRAGHESMKSFQRRVRQQSKELLTWTAKQQSRSREKMKG